LREASTEPSESAVADLEEALWRVDAVREKLEAIFALAFGVPSLVAYKRTCARFEPDIDLIRAKLRELGSTHESARGLARAGLALASHPAVRLRNQLSHQLAGVASVTELCWVDVADVRQGGILGWSGGPFYGEGALDGNSIAPQDVWRRTVEIVGDALRLLVDAMDLLAELIAAAAVLEPPQPLYRQFETSAVTTEDPRPAPSWPVTTADESH
jgi:hypothetical protein